ncbi:MAG: L-lactate dehydrogenase, partial [Rhizobiaceae bacterium]
RTIIAGKGYTSFGVATAIVRICEAIVRDERCVLPVSTMMSGQFGIADIYLSLPCIVGSSGIVHILSPQLSPEEELALRASGEALRNAFAAIAKPLG